MLIEYFLSKYYKYIYNLRIPYTTLVHLTVMFVIQLSLLICIELF